MAFDRLGANLADLAIRKAAESSGSYVGEIFSFETMVAIITALGGKAERINFKSPEDFREAIGKTGDAPTLIAFSNAKFLETARYNDQLIPDNNPEKIDTQRGHWSIIETIVGDIIQIANPWGMKFKISLNSLYDANYALSKTNDGDPIFNWDIFWNSSGKQGNPIEINAIDKGTKYTIKKTVDKFKLTGNPFLDTIPNTQNLDLSGYLVKITY